MRTQKWLALLVCAAMVIMMLPATAWAADSVPYLDASGDEQTCTTATEVTAEYLTGTSYTLNAGWYVVTGAVTIDSRVTVSGDVHLILADGCDLRANAGIQVQDDDNDPTTASPNALTIYGQTAGTGKLTANVTTAGDAAIGGNNMGSGGGNITINGGTIEATGTNGAGIGGGYTGGGGNITINGGTVTATSTNQGTGVGGGGSFATGGSGGNITINGGTVTATGAGGAGIGGGYGNSSGGSGGSVIITGGIVKATSDDSAGIGGGLSGYSSTVKSDGTTTISGGTVTAIGKVAFSVRPTVNTGLKTSAGASESALTSVVIADLTDATYTGNKAVKTELCTTHETITTVYKDAEHHTAACKWCGAESEEAHSFDGNGNCVCGTVKVNYLDAAGEEQTAACGGAITADNIGSYGTLTTGWYVVRGTVAAYSRVTVSGDVHLILADGCDFTVNGGIGLDGSSKLTIYAQSTGDNMGKLTAQNVPANNAGIGEGDGGSVTINGGVITSTGGTASKTNGVCGSGIGAASGRSITITINGGNVTATGGTGSIVNNGGAGIGGGQYSTIVINGGTINATGGGGYGGAGIGGTGGRSGGKITINGGNITANGNLRAAGIGGGEQSSGGNITINGGNITATGDYGAGIGGGDKGPGGSITISGGIIRAESDHGSGIGGGTNGSGGSFSTGENGSALIFASSISDKRTQDQWSGIIFAGDDGTVYGNQTLNTDLTIAEGQTLTIPDGATLTNNGTIVNWGTINGTVTGNQPKIGVKYLDAAGEEQTALCDGAITADNIDSYGTLTTGWYVVRGDVTIGTAEPPQRVTVSGDVHLILADGCDFTVNGGIGLDGSSKLTIYAQSTGSTMGKLTAQNAPENNAGIGEGDGGSVTINGGVITSTGSTTSETRGVCRPGIGAAAGRSITITINGGNVTATGGTSTIYCYGGAGIGGGSYSTIVINGGTINATGGGGYGGAGIGGTGGQSGGKITINGGNITAKGNNQWDHGAGIGGGYGQSGGEITINGGIIHAESGDGAGIGGGEQGSGGKIIISGGTINATGNYGAGIGGGIYGPGGSVTIGGGTVTATSTNSAGIGVGYKGSKGTVKIDGGTVLSVSVSGSSAYSAVPTLEVGLKVSAGTSESALAGVLKTDLTDATYTKNKAVKTELCTTHETGTTVYKDAEHHTATCEWCGAKFEEAHNFDGNGNCVCGAFMENYLDAAGEEQTVACGGAITADNISRYGTLTTGWYVVQGNVTIGIAEIPQRITVSGDVHLILADGCDFTANGGISVNEGNSLTIYAQSAGENMGKLTARNVAYNSAGIGGDLNTSGGNITINGGTVTATGNYGAGIGGGAGENNNGGDGGTITINGGVVTASSSEGAGIGGGESNYTGGSGGNITINGGTVTATSGGGAGIGGGYGETGGAGGNITITGGTVTANGGDRSAGIGGGHGASGGAGGTIIISGGTVIANGGSSSYGVGAGIGNSWNGSGGTFSTNGGSPVIYTSSISDQSGKESWTGSVYFPLTVTGGTASGDIVTHQEKTYARMGSTVTLAAAEAQTIVVWKTSDENVTVLNNSFTMPAGPVIVTAEKCVAIVESRTGRTYNYFDFKEAFTSDYLYDGTLILMEDVTCAENLTVNDYFTLDLNGHKLDMAGYSITIEGSVTTWLTIQGSKEGSALTAYSLTVGSQVYDENLGDYPTGTLYIMGGQINARIYVEDGSNAYISGGEFVNPFSNKSLISLLQKTDGQYSHWYYKTRTGTAETGYTYSDPIAQGDLNNSYTGTLYVTDHTHDGYWKLTNATEAQHTYTCSACGGVKTENHSKDAAGFCTECGVGMVPYVDAKGIVQSERLCYSVTADYLANSGYKLETGWYVVSGDVTINSRVTVSGDVHLILADGCNFTVDGGIQVQDTNALTIYAQSAGDNMGKLIAQNVANDNAGIGGNLNTSGGTITINGGTVTATSGKWAAGIGGGNAGSGGNITINGGTVEATGKNGGAGIGGGIGGAGGNITINGGTVTATGDYYYGAGIGGGSGGSGGTININGGTVTAISRYGGAGIGGGYNGAGGIITITGGEVEATGCTDGGAGIGGGGGDKAKTGAAGGIITISGGTVTANGTSGGAGIGGGAGNDGSGSSAGTGGAGGSITITGGTVTANGTNGGAGIGGGGGSGSAGTGGDGGTITISGGTVTANGTNGGAGIGGGQGASTNGNSGSFSTGTDGSAVIFASSISDQSGKTGGTWSGVIFEGSDGKVYGANVTPSENFTIESGKHLLIPTGSTLTISGITAVNNGSVYVDGGTLIGLSGDLYYPLTVTDGTADGDANTYLDTLYGKAGGTIALTAINIPEGQMVTGWQTDDVEIENNSFTMPGNAVAVTAIFGDLVATVTVGGTVTNYASFMEAFAAANLAEGSTLTMLADANGVPALTVTGSFTLDLNGKTLASSAETPITVNRGGSLTVIDSTDSNTVGSITGQETGSAYTPVIEILTGGKLDFRSGEIKTIIKNFGTLSISNSAKVTVAVPKVAVENRGTLTISGGTLTGMVCVDAIEGNLTINGGTFNALYNDYNSVNSSYCVNYKGGTVSVEGGTFNCADGERVYTFNSNMAGTVQGGIFPNGVTVHNGSPLSVLKSGFAFFENQEGGKLLDGSNAITVAAKVGAHDQHTFSYSANDDTHTATCGCGYSVTENHILDENNTVCPCGYAAYWDLHETKYHNSTIITADYLTEKGKTLSDGWYVVKDTVTIDSRVTVSGDVKLILADGCNFTVNGGIEVGSGKSLTIWGQSGGTGKLMAQNVADNNAAIGGGNGGSAGTITINGGNITATGDEWAAGIGGGSNGSGGNITINGGNITATGKGGGAGIGGGEQSSGGNITINGGNITATGDYYYGAGIGGGSNGSGGTITINGGNITATGTYGGAGIGGGVNGSSGNITISGGTVTATGNFGGAGIGGGVNISNADTGGIITITGGTVTATGNDGGAGIGGGHDGSSGSFSTGTDGSAVIFASSISDKSKQDQWSGIIFEGSNGKVYGHQTMTEDLTITEGQTLTILENATLTIPENVTLTSNGMVFVDGTLSGTLNGNVYYLLTLQKCTASGDVATNHSKTYGKAGGIITLTPTNIPVGQALEGWTTSDAGVTVTNNAFTMPSKTLTVSVSSYVNAPTYTVTIPATVELGGTATISASGVNVVSGSSLVVTLTDAQSFKLRTDEGAELSYTITKDSAPLGAGDTVLTVAGGTADSSGSVELTFSAPTTAIQHSGDYKGTVTFTITIEEGSGR